MSFTQIRRSQRLSNNPFRSYRHAMDLELRHLRIVCAVAEAGSVTKAAASLGLAQPAVTAQLRRIERTLGGQLFERAPRRDADGAGGSRAHPGAGAASGRPPAPRRRGPAGRRGRARRRRFDRPRCGAKSPRSWLRPSDQRGRELGGRVAGGGADEAIAALAAQRGSSGRSLHADCRNPRTDRRHTVP